MIKQILLLFLIGVVITRCLVALYNDSPLIHLSLRVMVIIATLEQ